MCKHKFCPHCSVFGPLQPHIEEELRRRQDKAMAELVEKLKNQKDLPPEYSKTVDKHFWDLI